MTPLAGTSRSFAYAPGSAPEDVSAPTATLRPPPVTAGPFGETLAAVPMGYVTGLPGASVSRAGRRKAALWLDMGRSTRAILTDILLHGPLSRVEVARRLGLSAASLTKLTRPLVEAGLLAEQCAEMRSETGRPSQPLDIVPGWQDVIGIKLNPDNIFAVRTDLRANVVAQVDAPLASSDVDSVVDGISHAISVVDPECDVHRVGVSLAANVQPGDSTVREAPFFSWYDVPLRELLSEATGRTVVLANDVRALTAAQHWFGAGRGSPCFGVITVGKGVGCGLVVNNEIVAGSSGRAGLVSHLPIAGSGPLCRRGHRGCASAFLTSGQIGRSFAAAEEGADVSFDQALSAAQSGNLPALRLFREACFALGVLVAAVANMIGPDRIVLSGEGIGMYDIAPEAVNEGFQRYIHWDASALRLDVEPFAFAEWARGGAVVAVQSLVRGASYAPKSVN